jgi:hypothetical protein
MKPHPPQPFRPALSPDVDDKGRPVKRKLGYDPKDSKIERPAAKYGNKSWDEIIDEILKRKI